MSCTPCGNCTIVLASEGYVFWIVTAISWMLYTAFCIWKRQAMKEWELPARVVFVLVWVVGTISLGIGIRALGLP